MNTRVRFLFLIAAFTLSLGAALPSAEAKPLTCSAVFRESALRITAKIPEATAPKNSRVWFFNAYKDEKAVGYLKASPGPKKTMVVDMIEIDRGHRNEGVGIELFEAFVKRLDPETKIATELYDDNLKAFIRTYEELSKATSVHFIADEKARTLAAIKATPAFKMRARFGYTQIVSSYVNWNDYRDQGLLDVKFVVAREVETPSAVTYSRSAAQ